MLGEFLNAVSAVVVLLMLMAVGYFMGTKGWMKAEEKKFLSKYIINIAVPCNCINGLLNNLDQSMLAQAGLMLVSAIIGVVITILLGMGLATLLRLPKNRWGVFAAMVGVSNTLFVGLPLSTQLFGDVCVPYVMIYYLHPVGNSDAGGAVGHRLPQPGNQGLFEGCVHQTPHPHCDRLGADADSGLPSSRGVHELCQVHQRLRLPPGADLLRLHHL